MENIKTKFLTQSAIVAALYATLTLALSFMSYGPVQFRVAEILTLLVFIDKKYFFGLVIGCLLSNAFSPLGMVDVIAGTSATILALLFMIIVRKFMGDNKKSLIIASFGPVISNAIIVGIELTLLFKELPFIINAAYVALGEFVVVTIVGTFVFTKIRKIIEKRS